MLKYTSTISIEFPKWQPKWILRTDRFYGCSVVAVCDDNKVVAAHANRIESNENIIYYYTVLKFGGIWCLLFGFVARKRVFQIQIQINFYLSPHIARTRHYYNVGKSRKDKGIQRKWFCYRFLRKTRIYLIDLEQLFGDLCGNQSVECAFDVCAFLKKHVSPGLNRRCAIENDVPQVIWFRFVQPHISTIHHCEWRLCIL